MLELLQDPEMKHEMHLFDPRLFADGHASLRKDLVADADPVYSARGSYAFSLRYRLNWHKIVVSVLHVTAFPKLLHVERVLSSGELLLDRAVG